jgi:hypothetical protein
VISFRFRLQKALDWRRAQLQLAEARLQGQLAALAELDRARTALEAAGARTELEVRQFRPLAGGDLTALGNFRRLLKMRQREVAGRRMACQKELAARQADLLEAHRRYRLLERLQERRWSEWQLARDREWEELASTSYLAQWSRHRAQAVPTPEPDGPRANPGEHD